MNQQAIKKSTRYLLGLLSILLIIGFFIPWVLWDKIKISGADLPLGNFFSVSENNFRLASPFPEFNFAVLVFWLIPALAVIILILAFLNKKNSFASVFAGILTLAAATGFILFTNVLADLGVKHSLQIGIYFSMLAAASIILITPLRWFSKIVFIVVGPLIIWISFSLVSDKLLNEKFGDTANIKADYSVNAIDLIKEFQANDSLANAKYLEKIVIVNGSISAIETSNDSTVNIKFIDTTTGSYIIFPFEGESVKEMGKLKTNDEVSVKGSCSGVVYSEILGAYFISFKRSVLNKK